MRTLELNNNTFEALQKAAAARGLSIQELLADIVNSVELEDARDQKARLLEFEATLVGHGGKAELRREDLYD